MLKVELHTHSADDPVDRIPHTTVALIDRAVALGYDALAITLDEHQLDLGRLMPDAADPGLVLIPGVERTIEGRHVLGDCEGGNGPGSGDLRPRARLRGRPRPSILGLDRLSCAGCSPLVWPWPSGVVSRNVTIHYLTQ
jgi:hypothetical protein